MNCRLTQEAEADFRSIYVHSAENFGFLQAEKYLSKLETAFHLLAERPYIARERMEIVPPVRVYPIGSHIIIYLVGEANDVLVVRIRHASEDWLADHEGIANGL